MRLIDADMLLQATKDSIWSNGFRQTVDLLVEVQPTVYDIDKVVEELERAKHEICLYGDDLEHYQNGIDEAIEIVKQCGVSDDVCEYKDNYSNNQYSYLTSCDKIFEFDSDYNFCPYCGKKIKIVGD